MNTVRVEWHPGMLYAPPDGPTYHQHFNLANVPSRYFVLGFGGVRYPVLDTARKTYEGMDRSREKAAFKSNMRTRTRASSSFTNPSLPSAAFNQRCASL